MSDDRSPEQEFAYFVNAAMAKGIQNDADTTMMAKICLNTARELWDHYDAGDDELTYVEFVTSVGFETAEIEEWLDEVEGRSWKDE